MPTFSISLPDEAATERLGAALADAPAGRATSWRCRAGSASARRRLPAPSCAPPRAIPTLIVPSPTFTLVEIYETPRGAFWHFDLYRLEAPEQVFELGWEEARADGIALVEWAERLGALLPQERLSGDACHRGRRTARRSAGRRRFGDL